MKVLLFSIVIELVGVNFGLIGVVLKGAIYRNISQWAAILGVIVAVLGLIPHKNRKKEYFGRGEKQKMKYKDAEGAQIWEPA